MQLKPILLVALTSAASVLCGTAQAAPLKIALLETFSGPQAATGQNFRAGVRYAIEKINASGGWNGEPVQLVEMDNQGTPTAAADKLKAAIADGVRIVAQGGSSAISGQLTEDVRKHNLRNPGQEIVFVNLGGEAQELTGDKCHFFNFRVSPNGSIRMKALLAGMREQNALGTKVYSINQNYSWGQDIEKSIGDNAAAGGYQVVGKTLHDVNKIQDFAPYVEKIKASGADTVMTGNWSNDLLLLMKATKAAGLKVRFGTTFLDQPGSLANAGEVALGHFVAHPFNVEVGGVETQKFVDDYTAKTGQTPKAPIPQTVTGFLLVGEALKNTKPVKGAFDAVAFAKAMESVKIKSPMGEISFRAEDHQALIPMVVSTVSKDAKVKVDDTDMGFKPVKVLTGLEASTPVQASCKMQRPGA